jgi:DNA-directed RNA polymerase specialized sigma24 family protein
VARAGNRAHPDWTAALGELVATYRPVLLRHLVVNLRLPADRAEDMVHAFLAEKLVERNAVQQACRERGRFRSFLLKVFSNFAIGELRRQGARKRAPSSPDAVAVDDLPELLSGEASLADAFDGIWARQVLALALQRMQAECKGRLAIWGVFEDRVVGPLLDQAAPMPYERFVERFGLRSPSEAANLLVTAKRMFVRVLHEVVRETVADERDVEAEIREMKRVLAGP